MPSVSDGLQLVDTSPSSLIRRWGDSAGFPRVLRWGWVLVPTMATCWLANPSFLPFPSHSFTPWLEFPGNTSYMKDLHPHVCLMVRIRRNRTEDTELAGWGGGARSQGGCYYINPTFFFPCKSSGILPCGGFSLSRHRVTPKDMGYKITDVSLNPCLTIY